jgi:uncharacterized protein involved in exopolysaccharide biosynthesis
MERPSKSIAPLIEQPARSGEHVAYREVVTAQEVSHRRTDPLKAIDIAWLIWNKRRFLIRETTVGLVLFTLVAFLLPKWYTATTRLMPPDSNVSSALALAAPALSSGSGSSATGGSGSILGLANQLLGLNTSNDLFVGVLQSRTIEDEIINRFGLMKLYSETYLVDAEKKLASNTDISEDAKTGILRLSVTDKDPERAAAMAQAYVEDLNQVLAKENTSAAHRERVFIEQRLAQVKSELDASAKNFSEFASANTAIDIPEQAKAMVSAAADLQAQLIAAQSMLKGLQQIYTDDNVHVRQVKAQVAELQAQLNKLGGKNVNPASGSTLPKDELYPSIRQLPLLGVKYLDLYRQSQIDEAVYELLTKQYEIAKIEEARDVPAVQVLDQAVIPQKKSAPHRLYIMLSGVCLSLLMGLSWIVGRAHWERTDPQHPWRIFAEEVHGSVGARTWNSQMGLRIRSWTSRAKDRIASRRRDRTHKETNES